MNSPQAFDEEKYQRLLCGLECSEVLLSEVFYRNRFDSEYYKKFFIENENILNGIEHFKLKNHFKITDGEHGSVEYLENGIKYLTAENIKQGYVDLTNVKYVSEQVHIRNKRAAVDENDILISIKGTLGEVALAEKSLMPCNMNRDVAVIKSLDKLANFNCLVSFFLISKYGRTQSLREGSGGVQQMITLERLREFYVPLLQENFCIELQKYHKKFLSLRNKADASYRAAETLLLSALNLANFTPTTENKSVKTFAETFASGRLDAEYYQKKYDEIEGRIKGFEYKKLSDICVLINHGMQPPYIENGEMRVFSQKWIGDKGIDYGFIDDMNEPRTSTEFAKKNPDYVCRENDILHYSVGANVGYCHTYLSDIPMMPGSFITLIRADETKINPVYLGTVLNSVVGRLQSEKRKSGTAQPYIYPKDLKEFFIPILPNSLQTKISAKVKESFALREQSKTLLKAAVKAVEIAIEYGEEKAMEYLRENH